MQARGSIVAGTVGMALAVAAGAFGAHALRGALLPDRFAIWQTAVTWHVAHALALVAVGLYLQRAPSRLAGWAATLFAAGIVLFAGSLYAYALTGERVLGAITPLGGVAFLAGWLCWAWAEAGSDPS
ncbi:MAG: DUF423 domain-containing protein [Proteobacteria bacterium]|nr:DUF423 domain-containing protein [Pseudomonadota bacterium]